MNFWKSEFAPNVNHFKSTQIIATVISNQFCSHLLFSTRRFYKLINFAKICQKLHIWDGWWPVSIWTLSIDRFVSDVIWGRFPNFVWSYFESILSTGKSYQFFPFCLFETFCATHATMANTFQALFSTECMKLWTSIKSMCRLYNTIRIIMILMKKKNNKIYQRTLQIENHINVHCHTKNWSHWAFIVSPRDSAYEHTVKWSSEFRFDQWWLTLTWNKRNFQTISHVLMYVFV